MENKKNPRGIYVATSRRNDINDKSDTYGFKIWRLKEGKRELIAKRDFFINALCLHNGELYDSGYSGLFKTLDDKEGKNPLVDNVRVEHARALCSHNGVLYDGGDGGVFRTFSDDDGKTTGCQIKDGRLYTVNSLCSFNGELYECGNPGGYTATEEDKHLMPEDFRRIYNSLEKRNWNNYVADRSRIGVDALCIHKGVLFDAGYFALFDTLGDREGKWPIGRCSFDGEYDSVEDLCSYEGNLYQANSHGKIYDLLKQELYYDFDAPEKPYFRTVINSMVSVE